ncbi:FAD-binding and (Fe-S)-binding domain-containing protein [Halolamina salifodinae]|uniref:D-lactate dehydrogenase (cytochrome) n=1 Tax=Halolamina salifodinae TaxID=1202767 RepID=A0A8T4GYU4_9EURY|nr:FAD-binding and (Fe-S)-binding domain-containing protein [Halolamina salifodinae]MBP1986724.1 FAD/FMN-containing dehydrogenase/Fe-S oxidoreductase [Halolamina salifodinae]
MAADPDPSTAGDFDYTGGDVARPGLVEDLERLVDGDVRFDSYSRQLYATDASAYEVTPIGVVLPESTADVAAVVEYCADRDIPVLPRGGGTSLAGQTVNEAVVLDLSAEMDDIVEVDPEAATATAGAGTVVAELNAACEPHGLKFAPDPAWRDKSVLGGAIGNNSTGSHSLKYGKTDAYVESCEVVLADGTVTRLGEERVGDLRKRADTEGDLEARIAAGVVDVLDSHAAEVRERYPELKRNVSGYNLDMLVDEATENGDHASGDDAGRGEVDDDATVNLARLLAGSEGTLAVVTEATVSLEPIPETKAVALLAYDGLEAAMEDVTAVLEHDPAAVEVMDDTLLDLARDTQEFADVVGMLPEGTDSALLVEFYAESDDDGRQKVADLLADRRPGTEMAAEPSDDPPSAGDPPRATEGMEAHDQETRDRFWKMRKAGMPILLSRTSDEKHLSFIEDCAIPPEKLPEYTRRFQEVLEAHDTFASFYAHAGPGVLHVRPLIGTKTDAGVERYESIADAVSDIVVDLGGSVSGEHGDGRARTQWNRKLYGQELWEAFRDLKGAFDPNWLLNPGQVCGYADDETRPQWLPERADAVEMTENLRFSPEYEFDAGFEPELRWENENGFQGMAELCHGCGGCRGEQKTTGGVMCPTYRAADEEIQATRGRANLLRQAMSGDLPDDEMFTQEFEDEVLDLCIGCKGCSKDCPSEVDMAKMKTEVEHARHEREGAGLREKLFANVDTLSKIGSRLAPLSNAASKLPGARWAMEKTVGIAADRTLPTFHRESFADWLADREPAIPESEAERKALLLPDTHTNYNNPAQGKAAVDVLEAAGVHVRLAEEAGSSGRPPLSKGFVDEARERAERNVDALVPEVRDGWDVVVVEPSDAVMLQSDYRDLLGGDDVDALANATYGVFEYLDAFRLDNALDAAGEGSLAYHGHCHQKATKKDHHAVGVLRRAGYEVAPLDSTCCGMAGSFGYEAEHHSMSKAIGQLLYDQVDDADAEQVVAPGASCRTQLEDRPDADEEPPHPIETLAATLES